MLQYPYGRRPSRRVPIRTAQTVYNNTQTNNNRRSVQTKLETSQPSTDEHLLNHNNSPESQELAEPVKTIPTVATKPKDNLKTEVNWQNIAAQLQADMDNFRKRQQRQANEAAGSERERLLRLLLPVVDNLSRALGHDTNNNDDSLRQGVELTYREFMRLMEAEGVTRLETVGQPFDPTYHEALAIVSSDADPDTITQEIEAGYTLDNKLLRPAKVLVAA